MSTPEENIKTILADWLGALRRHDLATVERRMDPQVFWQGVREDFICENRDEAMEMLREQQREEHGVEALELIATEEKVVLGAQHPATGDRGRAAWRPDLPGLHAAPPRRPDRPGRRVPPAQRGAGGRWSQGPCRLAIGVAGAESLCGTPPSTWPRTAVTARARQGHARDLHQSFVSESYAFTDT